MINRDPLVSIGMPVYNGEQFIRESLDSLLAQDYDNFELIISDNASTDRTQEICKEYLAKDSRIQYYCNLTNLGAVKNFNRVFELSHGKYFMWASDHDLWHPTFLSRCISILEDDALVVLAYSRTESIDSEGNSLYLYKDQINTRGMPPLNRYKYLLNNLSKCNMIYGLIRSEVLNDTDLFKNIIGPDNLLLAELALEGYFVQIKEVLFYRRKNRSDDCNDDDRIYRTLSSLNPVNVGTKTKTSKSNLYCELRDAHIKYLAKSSLGFFGGLDASIATCFRFRLNIVDLQFLNSHLPGWLKLIYSIKGIILYTRYRFAPRV